MAPVTVSNPLIVQIGVNTRSITSRNHLKGIVADYKNVKKALNSVRGYDMMYFTCDNEIRHVTTVEESIDDIETNGKQIWTVSEIMNFNKGVLKILKRNDYNYDGLLYFISSHGIGDDLMQDSDSKYLPISGIINLFDNKSCLALKNKPKIFFLEMCRGTMKHQQQANDLFDEKRDIEAKNESHTATDSDWNSKKADTIEKKDNVDFKRVSNEEYFELKDRINYSRDIYSRKIYGAFNGYALPDSEKGAYMTRSFCKVVLNDNLFCKDLDQMIHQTRKMAAKLLGESKVGTLGMNQTQAMHDYNMLPCKLYFKAKN